MEKGRGQRWAGQGRWGSQRGRARQKPNCSLPAAGIGSSRVGWEGPAMVLPGPGSCPSPELGGGTPDPGFVALSLSPEVPSSIPGLSCLEPAPPFPCTPAAQPALPPSPPWGLSPPSCPFQAPSGSGRALWVLFSVAPSPASIPVLWGSPWLLGGGVPSSTAVATPGWFAHGQPKVEGKGVLAHFGRNMWMKHRT